MSGNQQSGQQHSGQHSGNQQGGNSQGGHPQGQHKHHHKQHKKKHRKHFHGGHQHHGGQQGGPQGGQPQQQQGQPQGGGGQQPQQQQAKPQPVVPVSGLLEISEKGHGYLRQEAKKFRPQQVDPYVPSDLIGRLRLRPGLMLAADSGHNRKGPGPLVTRVNEINGRPVSEYTRLTEFGELMVIDPRERIRLETPGGPLSMRIMDLLAPIGRGQRGLIVAPPKTGKTTLLKEIAFAVLANHPDMKVFILLVDERPEEVTDFRRSLPAAEVWASNNDEDIESHVRTARAVIEKARRMVEFGNHCVVMLDSITRLGRAFNHFVGSSGRTMSGGIDATAMQEPRAMFGSARNIEHGGSLTIIASALIDTGSRMDELIFQEFKGTGNMELVLSKKLAERRVFPAIDLPASGTRKEEFLLGPDVTHKVAMLRRRMITSEPVQAMETLLQVLKRYPTNADFLKAFELQRAMA